MLVEVDNNAQEVRAVRPVRKSGNSLVISLPPEILKRAGFALGDDLEIVTSFSGGEITLRPSKNND